MIHWLLATALAAPAEEPVRLAVVASRNEGLAHEEPLHYADDDADRVHEVLTELGGVAPDHVFRVRGASVDDITGAFSRAVLEASALQEAGRKVVLVVYYTGHAGADGLHVGEEVLPLTALKTAARVVPASHRVYVVDACQAGHLFRSKGASLVQVTDAPAAFEPPPDEAWIASTGPEEQAFEVDRRRGALFTHFFVSGARGAADGDHDGEVTLGELYAFVHRQTSATAADLGLVQEPRWGGALTDLVVTDLSRGRSGVEAVGPIAEPLLVVDRADASVAAEIPPGAGGRVALPRGRYQLLALSDGRRTRVADIVVPDAGFRRVEVAHDLVRTAGVRARGGLVERRPWWITGGPEVALGTTPGLAAAPGGWVAVDRATGRGHRLGVVLSATSVRFRTDLAQGRDRTAGLAARWRFDAAWRGVRVGPTVELGAGALEQVARRTPDPTWGAWFGADAATQQVTLPSVHGAAGGALAVPVGPLVVDAWLGGGAHGVLGDPPSAWPLFVGRLGVGVAL